MFRINTIYDLKPIPMRQFDWAAYVDGCEGEPMSFGITEQAAVLALLESLESKPIGWLAERVIVQRDGHGGYSELPIRDAVLRTLRAITGAEILLGAAEGVADRCCGEYPGHPETLALLAAIDTAKMLR